MFMGTFIFSLLLNLCLSSYVTYRLAQKERMNFTTLLKDLRHVVFPMVCPGCARYPQAQSTLFCKKCQDELSYSHTGLVPTKNRMVSLFDDQYAIEHAVALYAMDTDSRIEHCIRELKYNHRPEIGVGLGQLFAQRYQDFLRKTNIDCLIPVPLHKEKFIFRGYNQSNEICKGISSLTGIPVSTDTIARTKKTKTQTGKSKSHRLLSMNQAFKLKSEKGLTGAHILLIDDVITTGATLKGCIGVLQNIENIKISVACIALPVE